MYPFFSMRRVLRPHFASRPLHVGPPSHLRLSQFDATGRATNMPALASKQRAVWDVLSLTSPLMWVNHANPILHGAVSRSPLGKEERKDADRHHVGKHRNVLSYSS